MANVKIYDDNNHVVGVKPFAQIVDCTEYEGYVELYELVSAHSLEICSKIFNKDFETQQDVFRYLYSNNVLPLFLTLIWKDNSNVVQHIYGRITASISKLSGTEYAGTIVFGNDAVEAIVLVEE